MKLNEAGKSKKGNKTRDQLSREREKQASVDRGKSGKELEGD